MAASLSAVKTAVATAVENRGILAYSHPRDSATPPEFQVGPIERVRYDSTYQRGTDVYLIPCRLYVATAEAYTGIQELDPYISQSGTLSIKEAIEREDVWSSIDPIAVQVVEARNEGAYEVGGVDHIGVEFLVEVTA